MASADTTTTADVPSVAPYRSDWKEGRLTSWLTTD